jgi:SAM-dependent methyltransferase
MATHTINFSSLPFTKSIINYMNEKTFQKQLVTDQWSFSVHRANVIKSETFDWQKNYLPVDVKNKIVLDIGAGEGESARFFLNNGASKVICIEPNNYAFSILKANARHHPLICLNKRFTLSDLSTINFDFMKMDIEGYEEDLLAKKLDKPAVVEVHGLPLAERFENVGWCVKSIEGTDHGVSGCTRYAYWMCDS